MNDELISLMKGGFFVFDGPDGCGKSTLKKRFLEMLEGKISTVSVREPGGTAFGEAIREVLLHYNPSTDEELDPYAETCLFMAARMQLMRQVIEPALDDGKTVLTDRFVSSTLAYQGEASGVSWALINTIAHAMIPDRYWPACTIILDAPQSILDERRDVKQDRIEGMGAHFHRQVRLGYIKQAAIYPEHVILVDASGDPDEVFREARSELAKFLKKKSSEEPDNARQDG